MSKILVNKKCVHCGLVFNYGEEAYLVSKVSLAESPGRGSNPNPSQTRVCFDRDQNGENLGAYHVSCWISFLK